MLKEVEEEIPPWGEFMGMSVTRREAKAREGKADNGPTGPVTGSVHRFFVTRIGQRIGPFCLFQRHPGRRHSSNP